MNQQFKVNKKQPLRRGDSNTYFRELCFFIYVTLFTLSKYQIFRKSSSLGANSSDVIRNQQQNVKRSKTEEKETFADQTKQGAGKMIELHYVSSDEEL